MDVIAVGGVSHGHEALAVLRSGIKAIQIASAVVKEGVAGFCADKERTAAFYSVSGGGFYCSGNNPSRMSIA